MCVLLVQIMIESHMEAVFEVVVSDVTREGTFIGEVFLRTSYAKVCMWDVRCGVNWL